MSDEIVLREPTGMELLAELSRKTDDPQVSVAVAKAVVDLQIQMERFRWEREERQAKMDFDEALNRCQAKIGRIAPNQHRADTRSMWADYAEIDRTIRPIYTSEGFSVAYSEVAPIAPGKVRIRGELSRGGVSKEYFAEITPTTTGPKGNAMATATDADAIALARARRYLLLDIFNIAVGIDADEKDGGRMDEHQFKESCDAVLSAANSDDLSKAYREGLKVALAANDRQAVTSLMEKHTKRRKELAD